MPVNDAEDSRGRGSTEGQRKDGGQCEAGLFPQLTPRQSEVLQHLLLDAVQYGIGHTAGWTQARVRG
jgi:hypothetical protein